METLRRWRQFSPLLLFFVLLLFPPVINQYICTLIAPGFWQYFCYVAQWWLYFIPAVYLSARFGYRGVAAVVLFYLAVSTYQLFRVLQSAGAALYTYQALLTPVAAVFTAVAVGRLAEKFNRVRESYDEKNANLKALFQSSQFLVSSLRQEEILDKCLVLLRASFGFEYADIWLFQDKRTLRLAASNIPARMALPEITPADSGLLGLALTAEDIVFAEDPVNDERIADKSWFLKLGHRMEIAVPLLHKSEKLGVLMVACMEKFAVTQDLRERLLTFANQLALALKNAALYREMEQKAVSDEMTGLYNYRYFQEALDRELKRAARDGSAIGLLMMDLDYFKDYNDIFGHQQGDRLLCEFGSVLKGAVRETDIPVRYGGDEFAVILPQTDESGTRQLALRVSAQVAEHLFPGCERMPGGRISLSLGYAVFPVHASEKQELIKLADDSLYQTKDRRRREKPNISAACRPQDIACNFTSEKIEL